MLAKCDKMYIKPEPVDQYDLLQNLNQPQKNC